MRVIWTELCPLSTRDRIRFEKELEMRAEKQSTKEMVDDGMRVNDALRILASLVHVYIWYFFCIQETHLPKPDADDTFRLIFDFRHTTFEWR